MYQEERMQLILDHLQAKKRISIEEICSLFDVSRDTARRDLVKLDEQGSIIRTRGGALLPNPLQDKIGNYKERLMKVSEEKKSIGRVAAHYIRDGEHVILDSSTTVHACAEFIDQQNCFIITNSINQADVLSDKKGVSIHLLGGQLEKEHRYVYGSAVVSTLSNYFVDKAFIGVGGISANGFTSVHDEEGMLKHQMMKQARQVFILADHSKFGKDCPFRFAELSEVDFIVTDRLPEPDMLEMLQRHGIEILIPEFKDEEELEEV